MKLKVRLYGGKLFDLGMKVSIRGQLAGMKFNPGETSDKVR